MMKAINRICIIGAGNMGGAITGGIASDSDFPRSNITVTARTTEKLDRLETLYPGIRTSTDNRAAASGADLVIIAVKPWQAQEVAEEIRPVMDYRKCTIASVVAGVSFEAWTGWLRKGKDLPALLRIIPNTAIALKKSTTFIASCRAGETVLAEVSEIFRQSGTVINVEERMMAAGTALASCGIAYALEYIDASIHGGVRIGFREEEARQIVVSTMKGALALLDTGDTTPRQEISKVTTPGGYTAKGLAAMEEAGFREAVVSGLLKSM